MSIHFVSPLRGIRYAQAWGPWAGTHRRGQNWQSGSGWDLLVPEGLPVYSPIAGRIVSVGAGAGGTRFAGAKVGIQGRDASIFMTHLQSVSVVVGETVEAGERIGTSGQAVGVEHLHIAMGGPNYFDSSDSNGIDPGPYLIRSSTYKGKDGNGYPVYEGLPLTVVQRLTLEERLSQKGGLGPASVKQVTSGLDRMKGRQAGPRTALLRPKLAVRLRKAGLGAKTVANAIAGVILNSRRKGTA